MPIRCLTLVFLCLTATLARAEPAPWHWWVSTFDGNRVCSQTAPGDGWIREATPFKDIRCRVRLDKQ